MRHNRGSPRRKNTLALRDCFGPSRRVTLAAHRISLPMGLQGNGKKSLPVVQNVSQETKNQAQDDIVRLVQSVQTEMNEPNNNNWIRAPTPILDFDPAVVIPTRKRRRRRSLFDQDLNDHDDYDGNRFNESSPIASNVPLSPPCPPYEHFPSEPCMFSISSRIQSVIPFLPLREGHSDTYLEVANRMLYKALVKDKTNGIKEQSNHDGESDEDDRSPTWAYENLSPLINMFAPNSLSPHNEYVFRPPFVPQFDSVPRRTPSPNLLSQFNRSSDRTLTPAENLLSRFETSPRCNSFERAFCIDRPCSSSSSSLAFHFDI